MAARTTTAVRAALLGVAAAAAACFAWLASPPVTAGDMASAASGGCVTCHTGIEEMHPWSAVSCVQCHGGDGAATTKDAAHVAARQRPPGDERVLGSQWDLERTRFVDPGNLRVAQQTCGPCHSKACDDTMRSLHATTAGHLADGLYENGAVTEKHPGVAVFPIRDALPDDAARPPGAVAFLKQIGPFSTSADREKVASHFTDLPRKACMQCHLWSRGRAVRGRAGMDGDYRGEGCSACHVTYADDGISSSADPTIDKFEPGHPREHRMVRSAPTETCARCHYGDASIGLSFRGLAQPVPGMPQTPDAPGLHRKRLNGVYYIDDPSCTPADVHRQKGMDCVDCHLRTDTMGEGYLYKRMEDQVEIRCETCHGTNDAYATGRTRKGTPLPHLTHREDGFFLTSRVSGTVRRVKQVRDIVRPGSPDYSAIGAHAMTSDHAKLACYACHSGWNPNFFGFHFDRNEAFTQLDLLAGTRTPGRVTTQEKVFSTFKSFYVGWDSHGRIAPYMVGFSSMASVHDKDGALILEQELPVTRAGLSGMTMIHHQTHTTTSRARQCVECHRAPSALGRGSPNFRLAREFATVASEDGLRFVALDRKAPGNSVVVGTLPIADCRAVAYANDRLTGRATFAFAASPTEGLVVADVSSPGFARVVATVAGACASPEKLLVAASRLYLADGAAGVKVFDISSPEKPRLLGSAAVPAFGLFLDGPWLHVAAGTDGLAILDVRNPAEIRTLLAKLPIGTSSTDTTQARSIAGLFQHSRPDAFALEAPRTRARRLIALGTTQQGVVLVDTTEPATPQILVRIPGGAQSPVTDVALATVYELGSDGGAIPSREVDALFAVVGAPPRRALAIVDVSDAIVPRLLGRVDLRADVRSLRLARVYNAPFLQTYVLAAGQESFQIVDASRPSRPSISATLTTVTRARDIDLEEFPLDRAVDADGKPILDVSHEGARWPSQTEYLRILGAPLFPDSPDDGPPGGAR